MAPNTCNSFFNGYFLHAADVPLTYALDGGVTHEFFGMASVIPEAKDAQAVAASDLRRAFGN